MLINTLNIEQKYHDELSTLEEWNYLRNYYRETDSGLNDSVKKLQILKNSFYGFFAWFRRYDYLFFSDSSERKLIDGKRYDILCDGIIEQLGRNKSLLIESPFSNFHYQKKIVTSKNIVSKIPLNILIVIISKIIKSAKKIDILDNINKNFDLNIDYKKRVTIFNANLILYKWYFRLVKPKIIFLNCYYDKQGIVKAAHELNIKVVEIQHGMISSTHSAYSSKLLLNKSYLPDAILVFGEIVKNILSKNNIYSKNQIFTVGSYYLQYLSSNFKPNKELQAIQSKYDLTIAVSLQKTFELKVFDFIEQIANKIPNVLFLMISRSYPADKLETYIKSSNVVLAPPIDCYNNLLHSDFHCTIYSTCALEASYFGIKSILLNIDNLTTYFLDEFISSENIYIVDNPEDFLLLLQKLISTKSESNNKRKNIEDKCNANYNVNIKNALSAIRNKNDR